MRNLIIVLFGAALLAGCSHEQKKADTPAMATPAATAPTTTDKAKTATSDDMPKAECKMKKETRTLEVRSKEKGCELAYTKAGKESVVASSGHGFSYCKKALDKIEGKLKASGYSCQ